MKIYVLVKPDGTEVKVNENSLQYAIDVLGWKKKKGAPKKNKE